MKQEIFPEYSCKWFLFSFLWILLLQQSPHCLSHGNFEIKKRSDFSSGRDHFPHQRTFFWTQWRSISLSRVKPKRGEQFSCFGSSLQSCEALCSRSLQEVECLCRSWKEFCETWRGELSVRVTVRERDSVVVQPSSSHGTTRRRFFQWRRDSGGITRT